MTTRSGANYNPMDNPNSGGNPTNTSNPSALEDMIREILRDMRTRFDGMDNNFNDVRTKTFMSEIRRDRYNDQQWMQQNELSILNSSPPPMSTRAYNYPRFNEQHFGNVKVESLEAPSFDGYPRPEKFLDWVEDMDKYFEYHYD